MPYTSELVIVCTAIVGAGLGFLWFNTYPAQVFMGTSVPWPGRRARYHRRAGAPGVPAGDHGGLRDGDRLGDPAGRILQTARRADLPHGPIHHHYEKKGWPEPRVIVRFWIITLMLVLLGLATLKVR